MYSRGLLELWSGGEASVEDCPRPGMSRNETNPRGVYVEEDDLTRSYASSTTNTEYNNRDRGYFAQLLCLLQTCPLSFQDSW